MEVSVRKDLESIPQLLSLPLSDKSLSSPVPVAGGAGA